MRQKLLQFFVAVIFLVCCPLAVAYENSTDWKFDSSVTYETGKFGTSVSTDTVYIPFTLTRYIDKADVAVTIPYIYQKTGPGVAAISGRPVQIRRTSGGGRTSNDGLGDIVLKGGYSVMEEGEQPFSLKPVGKIKFPTADKESGLGTGEFDETLGLEASKRLDTQWTLFGDLDYTFIGEPAGTDLNNEFAFDLGLGYHISPSLMFSVFYDYRTSLLDKRPDPMDLAFYLQYKMTETMKIFGGFSVGLSKGSPDTGVTVGVSIRF